MKRDRKDDFWINIGVVFPHDDEKDFNVFLQALPLGDGKIVLRETDDTQREETPRGQGRDDSHQDNRRQTGQRR